MKSSIRKSLDEFHYHELIDRLHCITETIDNQILSHPVCLKHANIRKQVQSGLSMLFEAYQLAGQIDHELSLERTSESG